MNKKFKIPQQDPEQEKKRRENIQRQLKFGFSYFISSLIGLWLFQQFILAPLAIQATKIPYSEFKTKLAAGEVSQITITDTRLVGEMKNPSSGGQNGQTVPFTTVMVPNGDPKLIEAPWNP